MASARVALVASIAAVAESIIDHSRFPVNGEVTASTCYCAGGHLELFSGETAPGCIGGCGGNRFEGHAQGQTVKTFTLWPWGGDHDGATGVHWQLTNGDDFTWGNPTKESCSFTFNPGDHLVGNIVMHGNGDGTRLGRLEFNVAREATGQIDRFACGHEHTAYYYPADGKVISGFFGQAGGEIDQFGIILQDKTCDVISREITDIKCVTDAGTAAGTAGTACGAVWVGNGDTATAHGICNYCNSSNPGQCSAVFQLSETHGVTTTVTEGREIDLDTSIASEVSLKILGTGGEVTNTFSVSFKRSWSESKSQTISSTTSIQSTCSLTMIPHTKSIFEASASIGKLKADIILTVTTKDKCGKTEEEPPRSGQVVIDHVPITALISKCSPHDGSCDAEVSV